MKFYSLNIKALQKITPDAVEVTFSIPTDIREAFSFLPGQYLTIAPVIEDKPHRRAYSICSDITKQDISILIKKIEGGKVSGFMNDSVEVNQRLLVAAPNGHFKLNTSEAVNESDYIFVGAGSGITPLISMIESLLKTSDHASCLLFYSSRTLDNIIYKTKLDRLKLVYKERIVIHHFISRGSDRLQPIGKYGVHYHQGRVDYDFMVDNIKDTSRNHLSGVYLCGPAEMIEHSIKRMEAAGIPKALIHREYFTAPVSDEASVIDYDELPDRTVSVELGGNKIDVKMKGEKDILRQLMADGYEPPYSCLQGTCSTCKAKLVSGEVKMKVDIGLESDEISDGYILTCQSIPLTEKTHCIYENHHE